MVSRKFKTEEPFIFSIWDVMSDRKFHADQHNLRTLKTLPSFGANYSNETAPHDNEAACVRLKWSISPCKNNFFSE